MELIASEAQSNQMETRQSSVAPACSVNFQEPATCAWAIFSVTFQGKLLISKNWIDLRKIPRWFIYNTILGSHTQKKQRYVSGRFPTVPRNKNHSKNNKQKNNNNQESLIQLCRLRRWSQKHSIHWVPPDERGGKIIIIINLLLYIRYMHENTIPCTFVRPAHKVRFTCDK